MGGWVCVRETTKKSPAKFGNHAALKPRRVLQCICVQESMHQHTHTHIHALSAMYSSFTSFTLCTRPPPPATTAADDGVTLQKTMSETKCVLRVQLCLLNVMYGGFFFFFF